MHELLSFLEKQHTELRKLISELEEKTTRRDGNKAEAFTALKKLLVPHMKSEEEIFYPLLLENEDARLFTYMAYEVHRMASIIIGDIDEERNNEERWAAQFRVLRQLFFDHIDQEEEDLYAFLEQFDAGRMKGALEALQEKQRSVVEEMFTESTSTVAERKSPELSRPEHEVIARAEAAGDPGGEQAG